MSNSGYTEVVEFIAEAIAEDCEGPGDVENSVRVYMESLESSVTERVTQLVKDTAE